ncbi:Bug family tripartite tricarboxylate transporter substrate binding protein [Variovorax sp. VNK109]|jgi:tripartite-type tricarboxylate transporter receptor subunit TctC|uniref:Bug family tripartite tricarboxylate transporter substrate binding protein n=1 Tax=Variovorax sp. VNK109 TaxID=3400919 RepID=UPI003BFC9B90
MDRRSFSLAAALMPVSAAMPQLARAQSQSPMKILVGFPPSPAGFDFVARQVAGQLPDLLRRPVVVDNRVGASGRIALEAVKQAKPDGETIILSSQSPMTIFPHIYTNLRFDPAKDFTPITRAVTFDYTVTVGPAAPVKTIAEFIDWYRKNPTKAAFGSPGAGTTPHFIGEAINQRLGVSALHVAYKGGAPALLDLMAGQVPVQFDTVSAAIEQHRTGKVRILATLGGQRSPSLPDVPTLKESGIDLEIYGWCGFYGPAGMDASMTAEYARAIGAALQKDSVKDALQRIGMYPAPTTPDALAAFQKREFEMWGPVIKSSGFKPEN